MKVSIACFHCGKNLDLAVGQVGRRDECPHCRADVHVCRNCRFYDVKAYNECREPSAEVVREKDRSNFCDYFEPGSSLKESSSKADLVAAAEALFRKK